MSVGRILAHGHDVGSGFVLAAATSTCSHIAVTANHVVRNHEDSSLQFLLADDEKISVERVERDDTLDIAVLYLAEGVGDGLQVADAVEGDAWAVNTRPRVNDPRLTGYITAVDWPIQNARNHAVQVLQLQVSQVLGGYRGYSGSPVMSLSGGVLGILVEEVSSRATGSLGQDKLATNVLYAIPIQAILKRFGLESPHAQDARCKHLEEKLRESYSRCVALWQALDVPRIIAVELAHDATIGTLSDDLLPDATNPLTVVLGDIGTGKSLGATRYYQMALRDAIADASAPIPVFLAVEDIEDNLNHAVERACQGLGDPRRHGATIVMDMAGDTTLAISDVLLQARTITGSWPHTRILVVSRPSRVWVRTEERHTLNPLGEEQVQSLLERTLGQPIRFNLFDKLTAPVKEAVRRPLFALLLAAYLRVHETQLPRSVGELITDLIERVFDLHGFAESGQLESLRRLAYQIVNNRGRGVPSPDFGGRDRVEGLLRTHLVVEHHKLLSFSEPLFLYWFAAQELLAEPDGMAEPCRAPAQLESWKLPLAIALAQASFAQVTALLQPLIMTDIVFAVDVLQLGTTSWAVADEVPAISVDTFGEQALVALLSWINGLGALKEEVLPGRSEDDLWPLGVLVDGDRICTSWYFGAETMSRVVELAAPPGEGWFPLEPVHVVYPASGIWRWAQQQVALFISAFVDSERIALKTPLTEGEIAWDVANRLHRSSPLFTERLPLESMESASIEWMRKNPAPLSDDTLKVSHLRSVIERLRASGQKHLVRPWPNHRMPHNQLFPPGVPENHAQVVRQRFATEPWAMFSADGLLLHVRDVYFLALQAYVEMATTWFPKMSHRLQLLGMIPLRMSGFVSVPSFLEPPKPGTTALVGYTCEPLVEAEENRIDFEHVSLSAFNELFHAWVLEQLPRIADEIAAKRKGESAWLIPSARSEALAVFDSRPITTVARGWIHQDLERIGWMRRPYAVHLEPAPSNIHRDEEGIMHVTLDEADTRALERSLQPGPPSERS